MYSAVRVNGRRLYEYARAGEEVNVKTRKIYIKSLNIDIIDLENKTVVFTVECSKGTYIRTICQDVGIALGDIDAAINVSDIVLMNSDISKVNSSINISKFTKKIVIQNIVFALVVKVLALVVAGVNLLGTFGMYLAVLSDVGVCLITILNTLRIIYKKIKK
jgi:tRNA U55 pseudouridine synthase TruB